MKKISLFTISILIFISCNSGKENEAKTALKLANLYNDSLKQSQKLDMRLASAAMQAFENFVTSNPNDSLAPVFQFRQGRVAMNIGFFNKADVLFKSCLESYPKFKSKPDVLFLRAHLQDDFINNDSLAKQLYTEFITTYPKHEYTESAKAAISMLGKSGIEIVNEFGKQ